MYLIECYAFESKRITMKQILFVFLCQTDSLVLLERKENTRNINDNNQDIFCTIQHSTIKHLRSKITDNEWHTITR